MSTKEQLPLEVFFELKSIRDANSLTLRQVSDITGISNSYLSQLENGKIRNPSALTLAKLCGVYNISIVSLLDVALPDEQNTYAISMLSKEEHDQLCRYLKFIRSQKQHY